MRRFVEGVDRGQTTLFPECLEDWIGEDNPVRVVDVFVEELDLVGFDPEATDRPSYHPSILLKLYIYGHLNRVQSSRRLEYEAGLILLKKSEYRLGPIFSAPWARFFRCGRGGPRHPPQTQRSEF
jgi:Transposase domain (DUF772)